MEREGRLVASAAGDSARADELLTCLTTNIEYVMANEEVEDMLLDAVQAVYAPEAVLRRISWNAAHVFGKQKQGIPPITSWSQRWYLLRFTLGALRRVLWRAGVRSRDRWHFWRFFGKLIRLRRRGQINSLLEVLLRNTTHSFHMIQWGRNTLRDHGRKT
jgi:hypothetical protein